MGLLVTVFMETGTMLIVPGHLSVEQIQGRRGAFCVGTLKLSIGEFKIKDSALDQFEPGLYSGHFTIEKIYTKGVPWRGGFFTELIAKIAPDGFLIDDEAGSEQALPPQAEPDPADDHNTAAPGVAQSPLPPVDDGRPSRPRKPSVAPEAGTPEGQPSVQIALSHDSSQAPKPADDDTDLQLFGVEIFEQFLARAQGIALDPTVDREVFRRQRDRLKAVGYRFDSKAQRWYLL
jgi:hypothetical protein